jgi:hypothetical protein
LHVKPASNESAAQILDVPAARMIVRGKEKSLRLGDVEALLTSKALVIDACRHVISRSGQLIPLETRPVLFALARAFAEASPGDASRATLLSRAFGAKHLDESHRVRLRVEVSRLRKLVSAFASIEATRGGFVLRPRGAHDLVVLAPLTEEANAHVLALLGDGESWSSSALALALGGKARARRWMAPPVPGFPTSFVTPGRAA